MAARRSYTEQEKERFTAQRLEKVAELHKQLADNVSRLDDSKEWQRWLSMAAKFHRYSFNNVLLITLQNPDATLVAGYRAWQAMGHQVRRGETAIKVLGPVTRRVEVTDASGQPMRDASGQVQYRREMVGAKPVSVFDASQVDPPVPSPPQPQMLTGQAPEGLWDALAGLVAAEGYRLTRGDCGAAYGLTDYMGREVRVSADVDDAQAVKTLAHELGHVMLPPARMTPEDMVASCRGVREVEAESVAYMVTQAHGLDSAQYTFRYVAGWAAQAATEDVTIADVVARTGARVIGAVDKILTTTMAGRPDPELAAVDELARDVGVGSAAITTGTVDSGWEVVTHIPLIGDQPSPLLPGQQQSRSLTP